jgi:hypothetical protein
MSTSEPTIDTNDKLIIVGFAGAEATWTTRAVVYTSSHPTTVVPPTIFTFTFSTALGTSPVKLYVVVELGRVASTNPESSCVVYHIV